jgi:hypothetical protein
MPGPKWTFSTSECLTEPYVFTDERMWRFLERAALFVDSDDTGRNLEVYEMLFGDYIRSLNPDQEKRLRTSLGLSEVSENDDT